METEELCGFRTAICLCASLALLYFQKGVASESPLCPGVAVFDNPYDITSDIEKQNYTGIVWVRPAAIWPGQYVVTCNPLNQCSPTGGYEAVANSSSSTLTIRRVSLIDVGTWSIISTDDHVENITTVCSLTAANSPSASTGNPGTTVVTGGTPVDSGEDPDYALIGGITGSVLLFIIIVAIILYSCRHRIRNLYRMYRVNRARGAANTRLDDNELQWSYDNVNVERNGTNHNT